MSLEVDFQNPGKQPLHELVLHAKNNGVSLSMPALSKEWVDNRPHIKYFPLRTKNIDETHIEEWLTKAEWYNGNLEWLIDLKHHRFWSNLVFEPACVTSIVSFLQEAVPAYIPIKSICTDERVINLYSDIMKHVLAILCRMVTNKETETEWITKEHLAKLLYDNFLFSVPMIFDLLTVYGRSNAQIVQRLIETVIKIQPKYRNDLMEGLSFITTAFNSILEKIHENDPDTFEDVVLYVLDCAYTLNTLVQVLPEASGICREIKLEQKVAKFYDDVVPTLHKNISYLYSDSVTLSNLNFARVELINFFRHLANEYLQEALNNSKKRASAEKFLDMLQEALSESSFIADYQRLNPVEDDIEWLTNVYPELDKFKLDFIKQAYTAENESFLETFVDQVSTETEAAGSSATNATGECSKPIDAKEKEIQKVLDVFPDLEVSFVRKLLDRYESTEQAIAAVLEGNLPPDLDDKINIDSPNEEMKPDIDSTTNALQMLGLDADTQITSKHIKSRAIKAKAEQRFLDDKSHIKEFHTRNFEYGYVDEDDEYDDEYDDSYEALTESETKVATKILKRTGAINEIVDEVEDSEESEEETEGAAVDGSRDRGRDFCENPELVRERWARNREAKYGAKRPTRPQANVVGNPKGQGQDQKTLVGRKVKNENKSSRANHNRRQGAAFKRNRGMIPS